MNTKLILNAFTVTNPCLKQTVKALIVAKDGQESLGSNSINNKVEICPRVVDGCKTGEGYEKCKTVCNQNEHAEVMAIRNAKIRGIDLKGSKLFLSGHTYCCENCLKEMKEAGIESAYCHDSDLLINF